MISYLLDYLYLLVMWIVSYQNLYRIHNRIRNIKKVFIQYYSNTDRCSKIEIDQIAMIMFMIYDVPVLYEHTVLYDCNHSTVLYDCDIMWYVCVCGCVHLWACEWVFECLRVLCVCVNSKQQSRYIHMTVQTYIHYIMYNNTMFCNRFLIGKLDLHYLSKEKTYIIL